MTADPEAEVQQRIGEVVASSPVALFMKGTPEAPMCGFSMTVVRILQHLSVPFAAVNVLESDALREGIKIFSQWPTIPQLYVNGEFIGGCDIVREEFENGALAKRFAALEDRPSDEAP